MREIIFILLLLLNRNQKFGSIVGRDGEEGGKPVGHAG